MSTTTPATETSPAATAAPVDAPAGGATGPATPWIVTPDGRIIPDRRAGRPAPERPVANPGRRAGDPKDRLRPFQPAILWSRWICLAASAVLVLLHRPAPHARQMATLIALAAWTSFRSLRPVRHWGHEPGTAGAVVTELAIAVSAVCLTGHWDSPLVYLLLPGVIVGGLVQGGPLVVGLGALTSLFITFSAALTEQHTALRSGAQWTLQLMVVALIAGMAHRVLHDTLERHAATLDDLSRLHDANTLLFSLHRVAKELPASLDLADVIRSTIANSVGLLGAQAVAVLLAEDEGLWSVAGAHGLRLPPVLGDADLPSGAVDAIHSHSVRSLGTSLDPRSVTRQARRLLRRPDDRIGTAHEALDGPSRSGFLEGTGSALYAPLISRGEVVGVLCLEHGGDLLASERSRDLFRRFVLPTAVAIDNARWFSRIRAVAADEERGRIAREIHDRIGQSLAYLGFELDRVTMLAEGTTVASEVSTLRHDVRSLVGEVRETLYDLRTEVDEPGAFVAVMREFLTRVERRSGVTTRFEHDATGPLPARQERELWQVAMEAVRNAERHAEARTIAVRWTTDGRTALLEVEDDGAGFTPGAGRPDSYGLRGMRERSLAIGARLQIHSNRGQGTLVQCRLETS